MSTQDDGIGPVTTTHGQPRSRFEAIFLHAPNAIVIVAPDGTIIAANYQTVALFGYPVRDLVGRGVELLLPERYRGPHAALRQGFNAAPRVREMGANELLYGLHKNGTEFPLEISLSPLPGDQGEVMAAIRDVTVQRESESRVRAMMDFTPDATLIVGEDGVINFASRQVSALFGYPANELLGRNVDELLPERFQTSHIERRAEFFEAPQVREMGANAELYGRRANGSEFPVEVSLSPLPGLPREVMAAVRDVTDRTAIESRSRAILQLAPDATIIVDGTGRILAANRQTTALFGHTHDVLLGMQVEELMPERFRWSHIPHRDSFSAAPRVREMGAGADLFGLRADGTEFSIEISLSPLPGPGNDVIATVRDVTDRRAGRYALERALEQERDAAVQLRDASRVKDEFLDIVAHELRTPITAIGGFAHVLDHQWDGHDEATRRQLVGRISSNARQMSAMVERLLNMSRLQAGRVELDLKTLKVSDLLHTIVDSLATLEDRPVTIEAETDRTVVTDQSALRHIVTNFLTNAAKFSPVDIAIEVRAFESEGGLVIEVEDHGIGIPAADVPHLFEHFFQGDNQRAGGHGSGVGLSVARLYTDLLDGNISATSTWGQGSLFSVWLPHRVLPSDGAAAAASSDGGV
ncbi:MAG: PAS domain S-box-containing protein [Myxococcota bacterium]|jgi:PAS domain S-box-containing protein